MFYSKFSQIAIADPQKVGDKLNAYVSYKITAEVWIIRFLMRYCARYDDSSTYQLYYRLMNLWEELPRSRPLWFVDFLTSLGFATFFAENTLMSSNLLCLRSNKSAASKRSLSRSVNAPCKYVLAHKFSFSVFPVGRISLKTVLFAYNFAFMLCCAPRFWIVNSSFFSTAEMDWASRCSSYSWSRWYVLCSLV